ncbi:Target of rapamycin complex subunit wat1 [Sparassis crispa]|uniref:Protein LST8 homolog n=1 Tax=Sparassis crispa TaxID=139825 RepID=A0A401GIQ4_9APHY|nr:Target of rapamycin complex subunit wat1 [Sparassis crispa]GBE82052.1 Target of rapamycin complex subunit wat1 [Sparassis crispa]
MPAQALPSRSAPPRHDMSVILVTGSYDHDIRFWEAWSGICSRTITRTNEQGQVNRLAISPDKRLLAAAIHKKVNVYEIASSSSTPLIVFDGHNSNITSVSFHSEGKWLVTGSEDGTIKIWDLRSTHLHRNYDNEAPVNDVVVHPNQGELISCDQAGRIKQWDLSENLCTHELTPAGDTPMRSISLASDGSYLVAGNIKGKCYVWKINEDLPRFQAVTKFQAHNKYLTRCLLSPDVKYLATCSADTTVKIWSLCSNHEFKLEKTLQGHQRWVWDCAFSADSAYLVTASSDHTARLWEMASGETVRQYNGHHKAAVCCALHDGAG